MDLHAVAGARARARLRLGVVWLGLACLSAAAQAPTDVRVALVIGNGAYPGPAALPNPANDAAAMTAALQRLGFNVTELRDGSREQMAAAVAAVRERLRGKQGVGLFYYAGHGVQLDWHNYMVPVDANLTRAADVPAQALDVDTVIGAFRTAGNRLNILVLDACRDNPFGGAASGKGLAQMDAPPGTFLAYATAPGNVAEDGRGRNGLYTGFLVQELAKPAARIEDVFKRVRFQVRQQSGGRQVPWESTSLEDDFYFDDGRPAGTARAAAPTEAAVEAAFAREKADWDRIAASRNPDDYYAFLKQHPSGSISEQAAAVLERLATAKTVTVPDRDGMVQVPARDRFREGDINAFVERDQYSNKVLRTVRNRVRKVTEDHVFVGPQLVMTREGGLIQNRNVANLDPPRLDLPSGDYVVGKKWSYRSLETRREGGRHYMTSGTVRIAALEEVTVPAGTFKAYRLELDAIYEEGSKVKLTRWMRPEWGFHLKQLREVRHPRGAPTLEIQEMLEVPRKP
jgi:hypothetical protein